MALTPGIPASLLLPERVSEVRSVTFRAEFDQALSKNRRRGIGRTRKQGMSRGRVRVIKSADARDAEERLQQTMKHALAGTEWFRAKVWVVVSVTMPRQGIDSINFTESVADVLKVVIGVDDQWFSMVSDWELDKTDPHMMITVSQTATEHWGYCPTCNSLKPEATGFYKRRKDGTLGECKGCKKRRVAEGYRRRRDARQQAGAN